MGAGKSVLHTIGGEFGHWLKNIATQIFDMTSKVVREGLELRWNEDGSKYIKAIELWTERGRASQYFHCHVSPCRPRVIIPASTFRTLSRQANFHHHSLENKFCNGKFVVPIVIIPYSIHLHKGFIQFGFCHLARYLTLRS